MEEALDQGKDVGCEQMTIEEAIQVLKMVEAHGSLVVKAKDMAIKALEQQIIELK